MLFDRLPVSAQAKWLHGGIAGNTSLPVTIRALDIGGDKQLPYLQRDAIPTRGQRGIRSCWITRMCFSRTLRAVLRANEGLGVYGFS